MPDCKTLQLLCINSVTIEADHNRSQVNVQSNHGNFKTNKNSKINLSLNSKNNYESDYFLVVPEKEMDMAASAKITQELYNTYSDIFQALCASKAYFH